MPVVAIATTFVSRAEAHSRSFIRFFESDSYINIKTDDPVPDFAFLATLPLSTNTKGIYLKRKENLMLLLAIKLFVLA